jgi:ABC-type branched-subunit amino acid transport system substrate-binding protein
MPRSAFAMAAATAALALLAAGCSSKAVDEGDGAAAGGVKTGPGVTASTISLGVLSDLTGPIAVLGKPMLQGNEIYVDEVNAAGGICGRQLELVVKDHSYDVQKAVSGYAALEPEVLGLVQLHGSPITAALADQIMSDTMLTAPASLASTLLPNSQLIIPGATYDLQMITALDYLTKERGLARGDAVGLIYFEGEAGNNSLTGAQYAAQRLGLTLHPLQITTAVADVNAQVSTLKSQGAKAILLSTGPRQVASAASVAKSLGYDVPIITTDPGFHPSIMDTPAAPALESNLLVFSSTGPISADSPAAKQLLAAYNAKFAEEPPSAWVNWGYVTARIFGEVLGKACESGDLTREGLAASLRRLGEIDTGGLFPPLDFSRPGQPSSDKVYIGRPAKDVPGGLAVVKPFFASELTSGYEMGKP